MTQPTHPHIVPYTDQLLGACTCLWTCVAFVSIYYYDYYPAKNPSAGMAEIQEDNQGHTD